jgi:hypothetical protein
VFEIPEQEPTNGVRKMQALKLTLCIFALVMSTSLVGCGDGDSHKDHDHSHDKGHKDHDKDKASKAKDGDGHEGDGKALAPADLGGYHVNVTLFEIEHGEAHLTFTLSGNDKAPSAVRAWVGDENATNATKASVKLENKDGKWTKHTHVEVAKDLAEGSKIWIEVEVDEAIAVHGFAY